MGVCGCREFMPGTGASWDFLLHVLLDPHSGLGGGDLTLLAGGKPELLREGPAQAGFGVRPEPQQLLPGLCLLL